METIISNPGLKHVAENIFWNLDFEELKLCAQINQSCKQILKNPIFCLKKFRQLSKKNQTDWTNVIQGVKNSDKGIAIIFYLKWNFKQRVVDLPCYSTPAVQDYFWKRILKICKKRERPSHKDNEIVNIMAPLTENPNASNADFHYWAAYRKYTEIVNYLALLTENPNAPDEDGRTPIYWAAHNGHTEFVKILAPLTDNPNAPDDDGRTPIYWAAYHGYIEIVKILVPLTDNPNAPDKDGKTPIHEAAFRGHKEIVKILALLTENPNAPDEHGKTPIYWATLNRHTEIVKILTPSTNNHYAPNGLQFFVSFILPSILIFLYYIIFNI